MPKKPKIPYWLKFWSKKYKRLKEDDDDIKRKDFYPKTGETYKKYTDSDFYPDIQGKGYRRKRRKRRKLQVIHKLNTKLPKRRRMKKRKCNKRKTKLRY